jgi:hypothetical protein
MVDLGHFFVYYRFYYRSAARAPLSSEVNYVIFEGGDYMKFQIPINLPYIEKIGGGVKTVALAPKRKADEHLQAVMAQALMDVAKTMQANMDKEKSEC